MKRIAVLASLAVLGACRSSVDNAYGSAIGNYSLVSVDGSPVPFRIGTSITVRGSLSLKNSGDFTLTQADSSTTGAVTNTSSTGIWSVTDNAIALQGSVDQLELGLVRIDTIQLGHRSHQNVYVRH